MEKRLFISLAGSPDKLTKGNLSTATAAAKQADMQTQSYVSYPPRSHESDLRVTNKMIIQFGLPRCHRIVAVPHYSVCAHLDRNKRVKKYVSDDLAIAWVETAR